MMTKILVLSDTHGNIPLLRNVLRQEADCDYIFHLGDTYEDIHHNDDLTDGKTICQVPGIYHPGYLDGSIPPIQIITISNWHFLLIHAFEDLPQPLPPVQVVLFGHTHQPELIKKEGILYANPGHLKQPMHRNAVASYMLFDLEEDSLSITMKASDGSIQHHATINRASLLL